MSSIHLQSFEENDYEFEKAIIQYSFDKVNPQYVRYLLSIDNIKHAFLCFDDEFNLDNCPCILSYVKYYHEELNEFHYYILLLCTKRRFRNMGYASLLLDKFIQIIKNEKEKEQQPTTKIVLNSVETAVLFYESYGFRWIYKNIECYNQLLEYEKSTNDKENFIMELIL